jgi:hypothetical protein
MIATGVGTFRLDAVAADSGSTLRIIGPVLVRYSQASRRALYSPPACWWRTMLLATRILKFGAMATLRETRLRQSISRA